MYKISLVYYYLKNINLITRLNFFGNIIKVMLGLFISNIDKPLEKTKLDNLSFFN